MTVEQILADFDGYMTVAVTALALVTFACGFLTGAIGGR